MGRQVQTYRDKKQKSRSGFYFILAIVMIFVLIKWGMPAFIDILAGPDSSKPKQSGNEDIYPPQIPVLSALPEATNSASLTIEGYTEQKVEVTLWQNGANTASGKSDESGKFSLDLKLTSGNNEIYVKARDAAGNENQSNIKQISLDSDGAVISIESPKDGNEYFGSANQQVEVVGKLDDPEADLSLNNSFVRIGTDGSFSQRIRLSEGENVLVLKAVDPAGNETQKEVRVRFSL